MSYSNGMAAINLEMPERIPRTEYSAHCHWPLVSRVTGQPVDEHSTDGQQMKASAAFLKEWDYALFWNIYLMHQGYGDFYTKMGHASYAAGGTDYDSRVSCPFSDPEEVLRFDPAAQFGIPDANSAVQDFQKSYDDMCGLFDDTVNMTGTYVTCMSGLIEILGWDMLLTAAGCDPDGFGALTGRYVEWISHYFEALARTDVPVVMVHDDIVWTSGAFLHPDWYRRYLFPNYKRLFTPLLDSGKKILYTSDGNYTAFIDDVAGCGVHGFVLEPLTDMACMAERYGKTHVIVGNVDTRFLLNGTKEDIYGEVKRCVGIGRDCPGFIMAVGNHIPANTPVDSALYYDEALRRLGRR